MLKPLHTILNRTLLVSLQILVVLASFSSNAFATCSADQGRIVINEYNYLENWIELKVLDFDVITDSNEFSGWTLSVFNEPNSPKNAASKSTEDIGSNYTILSENSCDTEPGERYIQIPFGNMQNDVNVVLADNQNNIVDVFRLAQETQIDPYYHGYNECSVTFNEYTDAILPGSSNNKDVARLPDGTGPWAISPGNGSNSITSLCSTNDAVLELSKTTASTAYAPNTEFDYTITVSNGAGTTSLNSVTVTDTLPTGIEFVSSTPSTGSVTFTAPDLTWSVGTLLSGATASLTLTVRATATGSITNTVQATATELSPGWTEATSTVTIGSAIDHIRLEHSGSGLTCTPSSVTVKACTDADCTSLYEGDVTTTLSPTGWEGGDTITFSGGITTASLWHTTAESVTLGTSAITPTPTNATRCFIGASESCDHVFANAGLVFDVPTQLSNKTSADITLSALKSDPADPTSCAPAFTGAKSINFWSGYLSPSPYTGTPQVSINSTAITGSAPGTAINLTFDANAQATFTTHFIDAGKLELTAQYISSGGADSGLTLTGSDTYVVTPVGFCVESGDTNADCASGDATCSVFKKAGENFNLNVTAKAWESDTDTDFCTGNLTTPNFVLAGIPLTHTLVAPAAGALGNLGTNSVDITTGGNTTLLQSIDEVGVFTLSAAPAASSYIDGTSVGPGTSANIGRFIPDRFELSALTLTDRVAGAYPAPGFTYMGEDLALAYTASALNVAGGLTSNYVNTFAKWNGTGALAYDPATPAAYTVAARDATTALSNRLQISSSTLTTAWAGGSANAEVQLNLAKPANPDGPYTTDFGVNFSDSDGVALVGLDMDADINTVNEHKRIGQTSIVLGRASIADAFASSLAGTLLQIPLSMQYYNSATGSFENFLADTFTTISSSNLTCTDTNTADGLVCLTPLAANVANGENFTLTADGNNGTLVYALDLSATGANLPFLMHDWDDNGTADNPEATITFGQYPDYHGEGRFRFWSETR